MGHSSIIKDFLKGVGVEMLFIFIAIVLTQYSYAFFPQEIWDKQIGTAVPCGWPITMFYKNMTMNDPPYNTAYCSDSFQYGREASSPYMNPAIDPFLLNVIFYFAVTRVLYFYVQKSWEFFRRQSKTLPQTDGALDRGR